MKIRFEDCRLVGKIGKTHGYKGEVKLDLLPNISTDLDLNEPVFLIINGRPVPFFIEESNEAAQPPILHFEDITNPDQAKELFNLQVYVYKKRVIADNDWSPQELIGLQVLDQNLGPLGNIVSTMKAGKQELLIMEYQNAEIMIPLQFPVVKEVVHLPQQKPFLKTELPNGLLELYLNQQPEEEEE